MLMSRTWQIQTAKQRFSELVRAAESGSPQFISRHGEPVVVVLDLASYRRRAEDQMSLKEWLVSGPKFDDLELPERVLDPERDIGF